MSKRVVVYCVLLVVVLGTAWYVTNIDTRGYEIQFQDSLVSQESPEVPLTEFQFTNSQGQEFTLGDLVGDNHLVVVVLRGNTGSVCPYCSTQTSRLIANYKKFVQRGAEVVVIYPIEKVEDKAALDNFLAVTRKNLMSPDTAVPFPLVLDVGLEAIDQLGLRAFLSKPATYILDKEGNVRFAYVGASVADRPSIKAMLEQVDGLAS